MCLLRQVTTTHKINPHPSQPQVSLHLQATIVMRGGCSDIFINTTDKNINVTSTSTITKPPHAVNLNCSNPQVNIFPCWQFHHHGVILSPPLPVIHSRTTQNIDITFCSSGCSHKREQAPIGWFIRLSGTDVMAGWGGCFSAVNSGQSWLGSKINILKQNWLLYKPNSWHNWTCIWGLRRAQSDTASNKTESLETFQTCWFD